MLSTWLRDREKTKPWCVALAHVHSAGPPGLAHGPSVLRLVVATPDGVGRRTFPLPQEALLDAKRLPRLIGSIYGPLPNPAFASTCARSDS